MDFYDFVRTNVPNSQTVVLLGKLHVPISVNNDVKNVKCKTIRMHKKILSKRSRRSTRSASSQEENHPTGNENSLLKNKTGASTGTYNNLRAQGFQVLRNLECNAFAN